MLPLDEGENNIANRKKGGQAVPKSNLISPFSHLWVEMAEALEKLSRKLSGDLQLDELSRRIYATDASAYREIPKGVALPKTEKDLVSLVKFARKNKISLIPRTAGTSLAGQVVGSGLVVDFSKYMNGILELNQTKGWVRVQPGVIRDELNHHLKQYGLFFAPETSTANRAMIGGMLGNNSCGANSIVYGSTRDHVLGIRAVLSDGSIVNFSPKGPKKLKKKLKDSGDLENWIYRKIHKRLSDPEVRKEIHDKYPKSSVSRRNTGYGIDLLVQRQPFNPEGEPFSLIDILAGSEGTLAMTSEIKLKLTPLPPQNKALICIHFEDLYDSLEATVMAMEFRPTACELMDHYILERTKNNILQRENRFFVQGNPKAILVIELCKESPEELERDVEDLISRLKEEGLGRDYPVVMGEQMSRVWELRKAGLGLLSNIPGDSKPVPVIEDTAVDVKDLPQYIREFNALLKQKGLYSVHYAHAGAGELHLRPILNLKTSEGQKMFREVLDEVSTLVKKYRGSLSGEHGDGRLRGEFIPRMIGKKNYDLLKEIKQTWDPKNIFNPGKIVETPPMNSSLRFEKDQLTPEIKTTFDFSDTQGMIRATEQCNGSGDCRKLAYTGGTMCPSYMATRDEKDTTRARANALREYLSFPNGKGDSEQVKRALDLCLSCKGCKSECPSNVDMAKLKAEWEQQEYNKNGAPLSSMIIANLPSLFSFGNRIYLLANLLTQVRPFSSLSKLLLGFSQSRSIPPISGQTLWAWFKKNQSENEKGKNGRVFFLFDEFTNTLDVQQGKAAIKLLWGLGYKVLGIGPMNTGRSLISKGFINKARRIAERNIHRIYTRRSEFDVIVGLEPSAILSFRDEYLSFTRGKTREKAESLAEITFTLEEFFSEEFHSGRISNSDFDNCNGKVFFHGHCHQKALSSPKYTKQMLSLVPGLEIEEIRSGCCGMAGSFGYSRKKFDLSQKIGELVLFPAVRKAKNNDIIVAAGTSCRHQIKDGTGRQAFHPAEVLLKHLKSEYPG